MDRVSGSLAERLKLYSSAESTESTEPTESTEEEQEAMVYVHIHMAKTGGSYVNGALALNYERACGEKGNSYDAYQANRRYANYVAYRHPDFELHIFFL